MAAKILNQTIIMLILILVGVLCAKTKIISKSANKELSAFVLQVVNPILIFMSFQTEYRTELVKNLLITFGLSVLAFAVMIAATYPLIRKKNGGDYSIERFASVYSNCAFMGIPLISALFGDEGVFCLTAFITVFNIFVWTHGVILISGERDFHQVLKVFYSPTIIAIVLGIIMFFARIRIPSVPAQALEFISDLNTPLAMIVSGVTMSETNILGMLKKPGVYKVCAIRLIILPALLVILLSLFNIEPLVRNTIIIAAAAPPAAMCTLFSIKYNKNSLYSSEIFTAGTVLSIITLPIVVEIAEKIGCLLN